MQRFNFISWAQKHSRPIAWFLLFLAFVIMATRHLGLTLSILSALCTIIPMVLLWNIMEFLILPHLLKKSRMLVFLLSFIAISLLVFFATRLDFLVIQFASEVGEIAPPSRMVERLAIDQRELFFIRVKYSTLLLATSVVVAVTFMIDERKKAEQKFQNEQIQNRLKYLRAQINPHFLFNALNCIYALTVTQDEKAPDSVLKLSEMLRYVIDDCRTDHVLLQKEINYIRNYIEFQRIRMEHEPNLTFEVMQQDPNYLIPPMVLQPMIENCFKHSRLVDDPNAYVHITLRQDATGLLFTTENSIPATDQLPPHAETERTDQERTGIGLDNVHQRLMMLFGKDKCSFKVIEDEHRYKTVMHIS